MNRVFLITGSVQSGKTTFIKESVPRFSPLLKAKGFYSPKYFENGVFTGYNLVDIESYVEIPFIRIQPHPDWIKFRRFHFNPQAFAAGNKIIETAENTDLLIIDEVGPLELSGKGFMGTVSQILKQNKTQTVIVCRDYIVEDFSLILKEAKQEIYVLKPGHWDSIFEIVNTY